MKKIIITLAALLLISISQAAISQSNGVAITFTGVAPDASAMLDVVSTSKGVLIPRMSIAERNAILSPAVGLQVYNTDCNGLNYYNGSCWLSLGQTLPNPGEITSNPAKTNFCAGQGFNYTIAAVPGATSYLWTVPGGATITSGQGSLSITVLFGYNSGNVCVSASNTCETSGQSCLPVNVSPALFSNAGDSRSVFCSGLIGGNPTATGGTPPYTYLWSPSASLSSSTVANPTATPSVTTSYTVTVTDVNGCSASNSMTLTIGSGTPVVFIYTGALQSWAVPAGVTCIQIQAYGAAGGTGFGTAGIGGLGGYAYGTLNVTPGSGLYIYVGQQGGNASSAASGVGGWNGGGNGGFYSSSYSGGGGGGATDVRYSGTSLANRVIVGGGGGGGASNTITSTGGGGGYASGGNGLTSGSYISSVCGAGGTQSAGGAGASSGPGAPGVLGFGGNAVGCGGGGGGGYFGGGGGGSCGSGGGGGGSSFYGSLASPGSANAVQLGNGVVIITY